MVNLKQLNSRVQWTIEFVTVSPIHIGNGKKVKNETDKDSSNLNEALLNLDAEHSKDADYFLIPGSSFRGVTRSYFLSLSEQLHSEKMKTIIEELYGYTSAGKEDANKSLKGRIWFGDVLVPRSASVEKNITPINRVTQKALPLKYRAIQPNTPFTMKITIENATSYEYAMIALLLRALEQEMITIGSGKARGFGRLKLKNCDTQITLLSQRMQTEDGYELPLEDFEKTKQLLGVVYTKKAEEESVYTWLQFATNVLEQVVLEEGNTNGNHH